MVCDICGKTMYWCLGHTQSASASGDSLMSAELAVDEKITALLNDVAGYWDGYHSTHHEFCYRVHAGCLAHRIQTLMTEADQWEYGVTTKWGVNGPRSLAGARDYAELIQAEITTGLVSGDLSHHGQLRRRRVARQPGAWEPVP